MTDRPRRIWITRTRPGAEATALRLIEMGLEPIIAPLLEARPLAGAKLDLAGVDALAFTSGHAVGAFAALNAERGLPVFTVGAATAALARRAGFLDVTSADGDARALAARIGLARPRPAKVLAPGARETAADLPALLAEQGVLGEAAAVYETAETALTAPPAGVQAALIHSPRAARALAALISPEDAAALDLFAISEPAAAPLRALPFRRLAIAARPDDASLMALLKG